LYDLSHYAAPVDEQQPCGPDCEYDGSFLALMQAVAGKPEQQFGDTVIPAVEPDWRVVERMACDLLDKTKDLRVVACLIQAATRLHGVAGFAAGVQLMNLLCGQYWDEVHPRLVLDGEEDPYLRIGALAALSTSGGGYAETSPVIRALRDALMAEGAAPLKVRDVELAVANDPAARYSDAQVVSILQDAMASGAEPVLAFEQAMVSFSALSAQVSARMAGGEQPDFSAMEALIKAVNGAIARARSSGQVDALPESGEAVGGTTHSTGVASGGSAQALGEVRSREDVRRALQRVCAYLEQHEPSSPASLFARRAERMLGMDFIEIVRELSPDSMQHIQVVTGVRPVDE
jgi:type VI secretion system protein ImpA